MKKLSIVSGALLFSMALVGQTKVQGFVFEDSNENGKKNTGKKESLRSRLPMEGKWC